MSKTAVITASYIGDFERCKLLCQSIDRHLKGDWVHYILVDDIDVKAFKTLESKTRKIISERDIFPFWLRSFPDPISQKHKRIWLSPFGKPLRGWQAQQLRRLAIARHIHEHFMITIDSDVVMFKDFDVNDLDEKAKIPFYRLENKITDRASEHAIWSQNAGDLLGLPKEQVSTSDYIITFIIWHRQTVCDLLDHIEQQHKCHWVKAITQSRQISECMIYGRYVDEVVKAEGFAPSDQTYCHMVWTDDFDANSPEDLNDFIARVEPQHVAIGIQSFVDLSEKQINKIVSDIQNQS